MAGEKNRLIVASAQWVSAIPPWLLEEVRSERWIILWRSLREAMADHEKVGDAEALAYLMTLSKRVTLSSGWVNIYEYLARTVLAGECPGMPTGYRGLRLRKRLSKLERAELRSLKAQIYYKRGELSHPLIDAWWVVEARLDEDE